jgi:hypothetical protein
MRLEQGVVHPGSEAREAETLGQASALEAHSLAKFGIPGKAQDRSGDRLGIVYRSQETRHAVVDELTSTPTRCGHHGPSCRRRLEHRSRECLVP